MNTRKPCFGVCLATVTKFGSQQKKPVSFVPPSGLNAASSDIMINSFGMCMDGGPLTDTLRNLFITMFAFSPHPSQTWASCNKMGFCENQPLPQVAGAETLAWNATKCELL